MKKSVFCPKCGHFLAGLKNDGYISLYSDNHMVKQTAKGFLVQCRCRAKYIIGKDINIV